MSVVAKRAPKRRRSLSRDFVTPEGVDLRLTLGGAGARAAAFLIDVLMIVVTLGIVTALLLFLGGHSSAVFAQGAMIVWLLGFFVLRNGWFALFELGGRGATPGKRLLGLRVVARDGARLTGAAVVVRNAMREIEVFLPLTFLAMEQGLQGVDAAVMLLALLWVGIFLFFPLFNRDRLRVGDLLAGTWVVEIVRTTLDYDLATSDPARRRWHFSDEALDLYGIYELQTLEDVLRREDGQAMEVVARTIRGKLDVRGEGSDYDFLYAYYTALCARLERRMMLGHRRADKHAA